MRKRILLAESNEVTRGVVESVLRKNGFEVIAVSTAEKAKEVLSFTRPDLLVVSADIEVGKKKPLYAQLQKDASTSQLPLLILDSAEGRTVGFPDEVIIKRPVDPREFIERVKVFLLPTSDEKPDKMNPLHSSDVDDDFLDAALGLDQIHVTDSEIMDNTTVHPEKRVKAKRENEMVGFTSQPSDTGDDTDRPRVESLIIEQDVSQISHKKSPTKNPLSVSGTGGIEISDDAYGLSNPDAPQKPNTDNPNDYNSFLDSLRDDSSPSLTTASPSQNESGGLNVRENSSFVDPVISVPTEKPPSGKSKRKQSASDSGGVERFIDEFKKEIEQMRSTEVQQPEGQKDGGKSGFDDSSLNWKDRIEALDKQQVGLFVHSFTAELAERIASKMVAKIDSQKLLEMLKASIINKAKESGR